MFQKKYNFDYFIEAFIYTNRDENFKPDLSLIYISAFYYPDNPNSYKIYKIDSINNYYLVYAKKGDSLFKIVSEKEKTKRCNKIKVNENYNLTLHSKRSMAPTIDGVKLDPINHMDIQCYGFVGNTNICKEPGIYDLYFADNLKGLCFIKNKSVE